MNEKLLEKYSQYFKKLNRAVSKDLGKAPHKPILLLAVLKGVQKKEINSNRIFITPELLLDFRQVWNQLVDTGHSENFALPFFHMRSEPFWHLVQKPGMELSITRSKSIKSFKNLKENIAFAEIDRDLFLLLQDPMAIQFLEETLLHHYFAYTKGNYHSNNDHVEETQIAYQIQHNSGQEYREHLLSLKSLLDESQFQEEIFIRGGLFKRTIPQIYDHSCCISGMKITAGPHIQMIDACHIHPFSLSNDDTVQNGLALSPNLHRAFDRGLLTINHDYVVRISPAVKENNTIFSLSQFEGQQINLPTNPNWHPSVASLTWHNKEMFLL